jgi:uncharacterized protein (TIGR02217 family)
MTTSTLAVGAGSYAITGAPSVRDLSLVVSAGSHALSGQAAALTTTAGAMRSLAVASGAYVITGRAAGLHTTAGTVGGGTFVVAPRLPEGIEKGSKYSPRTKVSKHVARNGHMQFVDEWGLVLGQYDVGYAIRRFADFESALDIFFCYRGRPFRFKNWKAYQFTQVNLGTGDGIVTDFPFRTQRTIGGVTYNHPVYAPVAGTISAFVDGVVVSTSNWTVIEGSADVVPLIRFDVAPANAKPVTATFQKDDPVIWATDLASIEITSANIGQLRGILLWEALKNPDV